MACFPPSPPFPLPLVRARALPAPTGHMLPSLSMKPRTYWPAWGWLVAKDSTRMQARASATLVVPAQRLGERPLLLASPWSLQAIIYSFKKNSDKDCMPLLMPRLPLHHMHFSCWVTACRGGWRWRGEWGRWQLGTRTILCPMLLLDLGPRCHESLPTVLHASRQAT